MVVVEQTLGDHRLRTGDDLLRRLEDEEVATAHIPDAVDERARDADHDRHVRIVTAGVHRPVDPRREIDARLLVYRQPVYIRTQHHGLAGLAGVEQRHDSCFGRARF